jgi:hypothetical protein
MEQQLRADGDARIIVADQRFNNEVSGQIENRGQVVEIQEENGHNNGDNNNNNNDDNGTPAPATPNVRLQCDRNGNIIGERCDDDNPMLPEEDDEVDMIGLLQANMPKEVAKDFLNIYELFLIQGASRGIARAKVAELFSPPRVTEGMRRIPNLTLEGGSDL